MEKKTKTTSRRAFLKGSAAFSSCAAFGFPLIVPSSVFGKQAPSNRLTIACIGTGSMGMSNLRGFLGQPGTQTVAVCDVDKKRLQEALDAAKLNKSSGYTDFRQVLARRDIDVVVNSTPDHWHVPISLEAVRAGKDVYCEKPLSLTISEGRRLCDAVERYGRVFQTGSHQRSDRNFRFVCELVRNGRIGPVREVIVEIPANSRKNPIVWQPQPVPAELDYDMWLGPAPWAPYTKQRCHYSFRFIRDYGGGQLTNWGAHHLDIVQWALGKDDGGPLKICGKGIFPRDGLFNTADEVCIEYTYENDVRVICRTNPKTTTGEILFKGEDGWIRVSREETSAAPAGLLKSRLGPAEIHLYRSSEHRKNFLECIRTRGQMVTPVQVGHRSATVCHLGNIAMLLGRQLRWDEALEEFPGDAEAGRLLDRPVRSWWAV